MRYCWAWALSDTKNFCGGIKWRRTQLWASTHDPPFWAGELQFFTDVVHLNQAKEFVAMLAPLRTAEWVVYAKKTFAGPAQVLAYLARYTHRVAIPNSRLLNVGETHDFRRCGRSTARIACR